MWWCRQNMEEKRKEGLIPRQIYGESGYIGAFCLYAGGCYACCDHYVQMICCSGASRGLCLWQSYHDCPLHRQCPYCVLPKTLSSDLSCGLPNNVCNQLKTKGVPVKTFTPVKLLLCSVLLKLEITNLNWQVFFLKIDPRTQKKVYICALLNCILQLHQC